MLSHELAKKLLQLPNVSIGHREIINDTILNTRLKEIESGYLPEKICDNKIGPEGMGTAVITLIFSN